MSRIGRYEVETELGRGSMGTVYLAYDPRVRRRVALKTFLVPANLTAEQRRDRQVRFLREAQAAGALSHPGIVTIFEVDEDPLCDLPFIAMEYVEGRTLRRVVNEDGPLPAARVSEMAVTLAGALESAHRAGVVHRDVKPANVLVRDADGAVKLTDFGVARIPTSELTSSGAQVGSPAYMSPEQLRGGEVDGRSDLFSLATVLYFALCGERPFAGDDLPSVTYSIVHEQPAPVTQRVAGLPTALDRFFERALAKDPSDRYPNASAFGTAFSEAARAPAAEPAAPVSGASRSEPAATRPMLAPFYPDGRHLSDLLRDRRVVAALAVAVVSVILAAWSLTGRGPELVVEPEVPEALAGTAVKAGADRADAAAEGAETRGLMDRARSALGVTGDAYLDLEAKSSVKSGSLTVLVDGSEVYSRELSTESRNVKRFFKRMSGKVQETFDARITVPSGEHEIVARVRMERRDEPFEETLRVALEPGESRTLQLVAGRTFGPVVSFRVD